MSSSIFKIQNLKLKTAGCALSGMLLSGCASDNGSTTRPSSLRDRQDQMLADPGNYQPEHVNTDITGGDTGHFDKGAFKRDVDHVLNP